jgi:hypothetical protein
MLTEVMSKSVPAVRTPFTTWKGRRRPELMLRRVSPPPVAKRSELAASAVIPERWKFAGKVVVTGLEGTPVVGSRANVVIVSVVPVAPETEELTWSQPPVAGLGDSDGDGDGLGAGAGDGEGLGAGAGDGEGLGAGAGDGEGLGWIELPGVVEALLPEGELPWHPAATVMSTERVSVRARWLMSYLRAAASNRRASL